MLFQAGCAASRAENNFLFLFFLKKHLFLELKSMSHNASQVRYILPRMQSKDIK